MKQFGRLILLILSTALITSGCENDRSSQASVSGDRVELVGAWRAKISFQNGPLAAMKDLEFLYSYNAGGTMTESSNYDEAANSSPPAYGVWRQRDTRTFETKYVFYTTRAPRSGDGAPKDSDWWPDGHGVLAETITLSNDGQTYSSRIRLSTFDSTGKQIAAGAEGTGTGTRIVF